MKSGFCQGVERNMEIWKICLTAAAGYLLGSISVAVLACRKLYGADVRSAGSGNAGATNVARVFGMKAGVLTFAGDVLKTAAAVLLGGWLLGEAGQCIAAGTCIAGHCWPLFFGLKGGKGVTVSAAAALMLDIRLFLLLVAVFFSVFLISRTVSVCSIASAAAYPVLILLLGHRSLPMVLFGFFVTALVCFLHRGNIKRILSGTEPKFKAKSKDAEAEKKA